jgi:hypothetical protein
MILSLGFEFSLKLWRMRLAGCVSTHAFVFRDERRPISACAEMTLRLRQMLSVWV